MAQPDAKGTSLYWKTVMDNLQEGLIVISPSGRIITVNRSAEELTGYADGELVGNPCTMLGCTGCDLYAQGTGPDWCKLYVTGKAKAKRCCIINKNGEDVHVIKQAEVLKDDAGEIIGAVETLTDITEVVHKEREIVSLRRYLDEEDGFQGMLGNSPIMQGLFELVDNAALSDAPVLINGESGTGKELVARAIHRLGPRNQGPFVKVNCSVLNEKLLESELFGHVKGAFSGADRSRKGRFEAAAGGDIVLDEIGEIPPSIQVKLLRVLEEKEIERVGDNQPIPVDVRILSATNQDLKYLMQRELFREDLYYRIAVVPIKVPPLRERKEDLPLLAQSFVDRLALKTGKPIEGLAPEALAKITGHHWPGNVRELKNAIEYAFVVCRDGLAQTRHLPEQIGVPYPQTPPATGGSDQREELLHALRQARGNQSAAARILGVSRMTVWKRMKKYDVNIKRDVV